MVADEEGKYTLDATVDNFELFASGEYSKSGFEKNFLKNAHLRDAVQSALIIEGDGNNQSSDKVLYETKFDPRLRAAQVIHAFISGVTRHPCMGLSMMEKQDFHANQLKRFHASLASLAEKIRLREGENVFDDITADPIEPKRRKKNVKKIKC